MTTPTALRLLAVLAHPDDESLGIGGTLAQYAAEGIETFLVTATRGERGRYFTNENRPTDREVGRVREGELRAAAAELGIQEVVLLDYLDGELDSVPHAELVKQIAEQVRRLKPHVVVTFDPFGAYGHPDHIAISQAAAAAAIAAGSVDNDLSGSPHRAAKLYYFVNDEPKWRAYQSAFKTLVSRVGGVERKAVGWPEWAISARIDTRERWETVWRAVQCHRTQLAVYQSLARLSDEHHLALWGSQTFYRVYSLVNSGRQTEADLFAGIR